ncbi:RNA 2'-phosphotransferase [Abditibacteriota bacterium]|nr:RNA 2'-phosphotransferase [Abditibacteriota bacterium]
MTNESLIKKSKWLSKHLRHAPERIGLVLEEGGWVAVADLLEAGRRNNMALSLDQLEEVVASNDKQRFSFSPDKTKIRANQGHSVEVDLQLQPQEPPAVLLHGTGAQNKDSILASGLLKGRRHHVHLSRDVETARKVGGRHGKPLVFRVDAAQMHADGIEFFVSDNGVWLCDFVAPRYLTLYDD